ncbi:hypothetical protein GT642_12970 [Butyricicoccus sp. BIOML-A1]|jgi:type I restriction enzyme S subunit|nr:restriction endonuclease subunit S [Butyricicoccus sp. BIOML-A1]MZT27841.1 hypothetical protein [Butyricicoccus sp. BIOML-A1]
MKVKLTEICTPKQWKTIPTNELLDEGYPVYGANGIIGYYNEYNHENSVVTITCRGATCGTINITEPKSYITGNAMCLDNLQPGILLEYLYYCLLHYDFRNVISGSAQPQITRQGLEKVEIEISSIEEQEKRITTLNKINVVITARQQQLQKLDDLVKARFVEMFGDMLLNDMAWQESILDTLADVVSGITKGRKIRETELIEVPYMAVSNVKDGYIDWTTVKTIMATKQEIEQYRLLPYDVLMTEGGDPDKLGRGSVITKPLKNSIHQNHIFRVRLQTERILPVYFSEYLQHQKAKRYFLGCAKQTTGIASINMKQLRALPVLVPPLKLQEQFATFVEQTDKSKIAVQKALDEAQLLFDSLMQKYFG